MNICEGSFYEARDGEGYVYVRERDGNEISYATCSDPTEESLSLPNSYMGTMNKSEFEEKIVYPYCECKGYTAWSDIPMDSHEACNIGHRISELEKHNYYNKKDVEELCNIIMGILDRADADEYEDEEDEA